MRAWLNARAMGGGRSAPWLWCFLGLAACQSEQAPATPAQDAVLPAVAAKPAPAVKAAEPNPSAPASAGRAYVYSFAGKRDPFRSYLVDLHEREQMEQSARPREETERYDTNQYRLTAILTGFGQPSAMVEDPAGRGHVVRLGSRVGKNSGHIVNIDASGLSVLETFYDGSGKAFEVPTVLRLAVTDDDAASATP